MAEETVRFSFTGCVTAEVYRRALNARLRKLRRVYAAVAAAVALFGVIRWGIPSAICACVLAAVLLALPYGVVALRVYQFRKTDRFQQNLSYTTIFTDTALVSQTKYGETRVPYALLYQVVDTQDMILVMLSRNQMLILEKQTITVGDPKEFFSFLCDEKRVPYKKD